VNRFERVLTMIPWLVKHPGISHQEVADHFQITKEQMLQDVMLLTVTGIGQLANQQFDVDYTDERIYVRDQLGLNRPFTIDSTEAACLLLGLDSLESLPSQLSGFDKSEIEGVREKIKNSIPITSGVKAVKEDLPEDDMVSRIVSAIQNGNQIAFDYWNNARDDVVRRRVSPLRIYTVNQNSKLDGLEHDKGWRTFRISNMDTLEVLEDLIDYESSTFEPMPTIQVEISVPLRMHHLLESFSVTKRKPLDKTRIKAIVNVAEPLWLARQVLASGCEIEVVAPEDVKKQVAEFINLARTAYPRKSNAK